MEMKKVLMIAYQFPPMGGSGVQRSAKFAKYLERYGWNPTVLTVEATGLQDDSLTEDLKHVEIIRTKPYNLAALPKPLNLIGKILTRKFFSPDAEWLWYKMNRKKVLRMIGEIAPDVLYTTSYPYSDHLMGYDIKKAYPEIPWVVDFRDEWMNNPYIWDMNYPKWRIRRETKMEHKVVTNCDFFITNTPLMLKSFQEDYPLGDNYAVIPNGYDASDFEGINLKPENRQKLVMTFTGAMYGRRKPDPFLKALKLAIDEGVIDGERIEVNFVGSFTREHRERVTEILGSNKIVQFVSYLPHKKSIEFLMNSDVLLLIMDSGVGAEKFYSGKIFEYINTGKTIMGLVPVNGAAADVIRDTRTGIVADIQDLEGIKGAIVDIYERWNKNELAIEPNWEEIHQYDRILLTKKLSHIFDHCIAEGVKK